MILISILLLKEKRFPSLSNMLGISYKCVASHIDDLVLSNCTDIILFKVLTNDKLSDHICDIQKYFK